MIKYDSVQIIAKNTVGDVASLVRYGKVWKFIVEYKGQDQFETGFCSLSKKDQLFKARSFLLSSLCGCFTDEDILLPEVNYLTPDQQVAINQAIKILQQSNSDNAEQSCYYLKQLIN